MLDHEFRNMGVVLGGHVEGGRHDGATDGALHVRDLLGAFVHEQAEEVHLGVVRRDGLADFLEHGGLAGLRGAHDKAALALADGSHEIDGAPCDGVLAVLHDEGLVGIDRREVAEARAVAHGLGSTAVDALHVLQRRVLAVAAPWADGALDAVTWTQRVLADDRLVHEGVVIALHVVSGPNPTVALVADLQDAVDGAKALCTRGGQID